MWTEKQNIIEEGQEFQSWDPGWISSKTELIDSLFTSFLLEMFSLLLSRQTIFLLERNWRYCRRYRSVFLPLSHEYDIICSVGMSRPFLILFSFQTEGEKSFPLDLSIFANLSLFQRVTLLILGDVASFPCSGSSFWAWVSQRHPLPQHCVSLFKYFLLFISCLGLF